MQTRITLPASAQSHTHGVPRVIWKSTRKGYIELEKKKDQAYLVQTQLIPDQRGTERHTPRFMKVFLLLKAKSQGNITLRFVLMNYIVFSCFIRKSKVK